MSFTSLGCRFCLKTIQSNEKMALIDEEVKSQFISLTEIKLDLQIGLSKVVCEVCLRSVQLAAALKYQFIHNQKKLYAEIEDVELEGETSQINPEIRIKYIQESVDDSMKSVPEVGLKSRLRKSAAKKRKISTEKEISESASNSSFLNEETSNSMEPKIVIKEEQFEQEEIQFSNNFFDQFNNSDTNPLDNNDSDTSDLLQELVVKTNDSKKITPDLPRNKVWYKNRQYNVKTGERVIPCVYCGRPYNKRHMTRHINVEHKKIKFPCIVPNCTSSYSRKEKLKNHIHAKHKDCSEEEFVELLEKLKALKPIYDNVNHVEKDQPKIKFYCVVPDCQSSYTNKRMLKTHITDKHSYLTAIELAQVMENFEELQPVYEVSDDLAVNPEDIIKGKNILGLK